MSNSMSWDQPMSSPSSRTYRRRLESPVLDWKELKLGDDVVIVDRRGVLTPASVDTVGNEGSMVWLEPLGLGHRTLYLRTDPIMIHRMQ